MAGTKITSVPFTYTGSWDAYEYTPGRFYARFLTSGTLTPTQNMQVDVFLVGGGSSGRNTNGKAVYVGGGGGYTKTFRNLNLSTNSISVTVGKGGTAGNNENGGSTSFGASYSAGGGNAATGDGGSGGGGIGTSNPGAGEQNYGGSDGSDGRCGPFNITAQPGIGQHTTTRAFEADMPPFNTVEFLFSAGGGASGGYGGEPNGANGGTSGSNGMDALANTGNGGGAGWANSSYSTDQRVGGAGGSGIVIIRGVLNSPPTTPPSITYGTPDAGKSLVLTCGASTDPDGDTLQYVWESRVDSGVYAQNAVTSSTTATITVPNSGTAWQARVKAVDSYDNESAYCTGAAKTINYNSPPTISGTDINLKAGPAPVSYDYTVNDINGGDVLTVTERLDGATLRTFTATRGQQYTVDTRSLWLTLLSGAHEITITVTDSPGASATRKVSFTKTAARIAASRAVATDYPVKKCTVILQPFDQPNPATIHVEATNNPFDTAPVWEDISVFIGGEYIFTNTNVNSPGIGLRVSIAPQTAGKTVYFDGIIVRVVG